MGGLSDIGDWIGETIEGAIAWGEDALDWVGEKVSEVWDSDLGKLAMIAGAVYLGGVALTGSWTWQAAAVEPAMFGTGVEAAGAAELSLSAPGFASGAAEGSLMTAGEVVGTDAVISGAGALEATEGLAAMESVGGTAAGADLSLAGAAEPGIGMTAGSTAAQPGVLSTTESTANPFATVAEKSWAEKNPMMAYGGMMAGGQAVSGYMQGEAMKEMEEQRLKEEQEARDRQNIWGVNYAEGGEGINVGDRLKDLNRAYFDSAAPINPAVQNYALPSERQRAGVLDEITGTANPEQYAHRPGLA